MRTTFLATTFLITPATVAMCGGTSGGGGGSSSSSSSSSDDGGGTSGGGDASGGGGSSSGTGGSGGGAAPACSAYDSQDEESAPIQTAGAGLPSGAASLTWGAPSAWTSWIDYQGTPGSAATHEGIDWVHDDPSDAEVDVAVAADGEVVYVRTGCPESGTFSRNTSLRECGSGWGNHVVVHHGGQAYTRYAHLADGQVFVEVGDELSRGDVLGVMGNSGRSEVRHLHFELGAMSDTIDPCAPAFSFAAVHDPAGVGL